MQNKNHFSKKLFITAAVTVLIFALLLWQHFHGGVPVHHFLQQKDLPGISNWWGALLLPALTWILLGRIQKRITNAESPAAQNNYYHKKIIGLFLAGLIMGISIAVSFTYDYKIFLDNVLYILLILSLFIPLYYPEFILGFVIGMTVTFGAILPTIFILVIAAIGFLIHRFIRPLLWKVVKVLTK